jgi:hypothetical protein
VQAFFCCKSLEEITIPEKINCIDTMAFALCSNLKKIVFENPDGWIRENWGTYTPISSSELKNPSKAAELFVKTYSNYNFERI